MKKNDIERAKSYLRRMMDIGNPRGITDKQVNRIIDNFNKAIAYQTVSAMDLLDELSSPITEEYVLCNDQFAQCHAGMYERTINKDCTLVIDFNNSEVYIRTYSDRIHISSTDTTVERINNIINSLAS